MNGRSPKLESGASSILTRRSTSSLDSLGQRGRDVESHRVTDHHRALHLEPAQGQRDEAPLVLHRVAALRLLGATEAQQVDTNHPMAPGQQGSHPIPPVKRGAEAVQEHDRRLAWPDRGAQAYRRWAPARPPASRRRGGRVFVPRSRSPQRPWFAGRGRSCSPPAGSPTRPRRRSGSSSAVSRGRLGARGESELVGPLGHRLDHEGDVLVEVDPELLGPAADLVAIDAGGEGGLLSASCGPTSASSPRSRWGAPGRRRR